MLSDNIFQAFGESLRGEMIQPDDQWYWKADFVNELSEKAIALHVEHGSRLPTMQSAMNLCPINGAAHRVGRKDTAFSYREATWAEVIVDVDPDPGKKERIRTWSKSTGMLCILIQPVVPTSIS